MNKRTAAKGATKPPPEEMEAPIRILKDASCPTLSGRSTLKYQIGYGLGSACLFRLYANTGGGVFNADWIALEAINELLANFPEGRQVTSHRLASLYRGKSANSPAFLFAVLVAEGIVQLTSETPRIYHKGNSETLLAEVGSLLEAGCGLSDSAAVAPGGQGKGTGRKKLLRAHA